MFSKIGERYIYRTNNCEEIRDIITDLEIQFSFIIKKGEVNDDNAK